jgi:hypothetical protein
MAEQGMASIWAAFLLSVRGGVTLLHLLATRLCLGAGLLHVRGWLWLSVGVWVGLLEGHTWIVRTYG